MRLLVTTLFVGGVDSRDYGTRIFVNSFKSGILNFASPALSNLCRHGPKTSL